MNFKAIQAYAPAVAIVVILLGFLLIEFVILPARKTAVAPEAANSPEAGAVESKETTTKEEKQTKITNKPTDTAALEKPANTPSWHTFHGGGGLLGYAEVAFQDALAQRWQFLADGAVLQPPVANQDTIFVTTAAGRVTALDYHGAQRWTQSISGEKTENVEAPLLLAGDLLLVGTQSGRLVALDAASGAPRWEFNVGGQILGAPNADAAGGMVYVLERSEGVLHALDASSGALRWKTDPIARCDGPVSVADGIVAFGSCLPGLHAYAAADGKRIAEIDLCSDCQVAGGIALLGTEAYAGNRSGSLLRADLRAGTILWTNAESSREVFTTPAIGTTLAIAANDDGALIAVDRATGATRWRHEVNTQASSAIIIGDKVAFSARGALQLLRLDTGAPVWQFEVSDQITAPALAGDLLLVGSEDGTLAAFGAPGAAP